MDMLLRECSSQKVAHQVRSLCQSISTIDDIVADRGWESITDIANDFDDEDEAERILGTTGKAIFKITDSFADGSVKQLEMDDVELTPRTMKSKEGK